MEKHKPSKEFLILIIVILLISSGVLFWSSGLLRLPVSKPANVKSDIVPVDITQYEVMSENEVREYQSRDFVAKMPKDWKPCIEDGKSSHCVFWDDDEYHSYLKVNGNSPKTLVRLEEPSYSKEYYRLATIVIDCKRYQDALKYLDQALALEPDHPSIYSEKAYVLAVMKRHQEAYDLQKTAFSVRAWATDHQKARALRGMGNSLINLGRLDEAEQDLKRSLTLEPNNELALNELEYIKKLRSKKE